MKKLNSYLFSHSLELKPCPFCGSEDLDIFGATVTCRNCGACACSTIRNHLAKEKLDDVVEKWNKRASIE
jgi:disulfide bond formation protein DsbB